MMQPIAPPAPQQPIAQQQRFSVPQLQQQLQQQPPKANTYSAVKHMVSQMESQIQGENADEDKHRAWCDAELSKNVAVADDKEAKLQRLSTKLDNEKETVNEVEQDLQLLAQEAQQITGEMQ